MPSVQMSPVERRIKARKIRAMLRIDEPMNKAAENHHVSRAHGYRMLEELEAWEKANSFDKQAAEINAQFSHYHPMKWTLASGAMIMAYTNGEIESSLLNDVEQSDYAIGLAAEADPLMQ